MMEDTSQRKTPPDRPPDSERDGRSKKKRMEEVPQEVMDDQMEEQDRCMDKQKNEGSVIPQGKTQVLSYKQSLMGFNGVANVSHPLETEDLLLEEEDIYWEMPEPSEEIKRLKRIYPVVPVSPEEYNEWCKPWNFSLIITVLGRRFNIYMLKSHLIKLWGFSEIELIDLPNNYFVVKFTNKEQWKQQYKRVLYGGPWVIFQHCVLVQRWTPYFDPFKNQLRRIVTWVRIPNIPMHCYNNHCIVRLGERIGRPLKVDLNTLSDSYNHTAKVERGKYARLCVELDLQRALVPRVIVAEECFNVEYEGLKLICFECGRYGHRREACPWKCSSSNPGPVPNATPSPGDGSSTVEIGSGGCGNESVGKQQQAAAATMQIIAGRRTDATGTVANGGLDGYVAELERSRDNLAELCAISGARKEPTSPASEKFGTWMLVQRSKQARQPTGGRRQGRELAAAGTVARKHIGCCTLDCVYI